VSNDKSKSNSARKESIALSLAIHNHQPVGNFDFVFERAYQQAYEPMVAALERHPAVRIALHYTGPLRDWLLANRPQLIERVHALVARGQVEMMSGGYYEPILIALPDTDKQGQIRKLSLAVQDDFDTVPSGAWLAERIWEPHLARDLWAAGIDYTIVDDTHFTSAGLNEEQLFGYYVTEEQGHTLKIFATSRTLRYAIPWEQPEQVLEWLRGQADDTGNRVAVMGDDGEKFGLWPGTYEHCWGSEQWIERFFSLLEASGDWLRTVPPGECAHRFPPLGRVYLPTASYEEMMEWALPAGLAGAITEVKHRLQEEGRGETLHFVRGGFWRNFMVKYPEINTMHKKMLRVSEKIQQLRPDYGGEDPGIQQALEHLWAGQCNCPYWHGVFGGIYLFHIRAATFEHLIKAERLIDSLKHGQGAWVDVSVTDFDRDGRIP
jgi:alpha-amylase